MSFSTIQKNRCCYAYVGDNFEMLMMVLSIFVIYLLTLASGTNIQKMSPISKCCQQHRCIHLYLFEVQSVVYWKTHRLNFDNAHTNSPACVGFFKAPFGFAMNRIQWFSFPTSYWLYWWNSSKRVNEIWNWNLSLGSFQKDHWVPPNRFSLFGVIYEIDKNS